MRLLKLMSDGGFHSGESLGKELGISRAAVCKQIHKWELRGQSFDIVPGRGYRWRAPIEWWSEAALLAVMPPSTRSIVSRLHIDETAGSTNTLAMEFLAREQRPGAVFIAEEQTAGRGRRGRQWLAPLGMGFYASLTWVFDDGVSALQGLSLAVGLAVASALARYGVKGVGLKWPNDIMVGDAKLGGVLIEMQMDGDGRCLVVIGVGLNLAACPLLWGLQREVAVVEDSLDGQLLERNRIGGMVLGDILALLADYGPGSFAALRSKWCELDVLQGRHVVVEGGGVSGIGRGVDAQGALQIDVGGEIRTVNSGEVSLRLA